VAPVIGNFAHRQALDGLAHGLEKGSRLGAASAVTSRNDPLSGIDPRLEDGVAVSNGHLHSATNGDVAFVSSRIQGRECSVVGCSETVSSRISRD
jgi:hypothetical protein